MNKLNTRTPIYCLKYLYANINNIENTVMETVT